MRCPHCEFENPEANTTCFRCGQGLDLDDVNVEPPRARGRRSNPWLERMHLAINRYRSGPAHPRPRTSATVSAFLSLIPGLGHLLNGRPVRAAVLLLVWLATILYTAYTAPPAPLGELIIDWINHPQWLPLTTHAWIVADAYQLGMRAQGARAGLLEMGAVTMAVVFILASAPLLTHLDVVRRQALDQRLVRVTDAYGDPNVQNDDVILLQDVYRDAHGIPRGTVVLATLHRAQFAEQVLGTVRAIGGDVIAWSQERREFTVNAQPQPLPTYVLAVLERLPGQSFVLKPGELLVWRAPQIPLMSIGQAVLTENQVDALVLRITDPPARRKILRTR